MSKRSPMSPPFYILINDTDKEHIKYYHEVHFQGADYEGEVNSDYTTRLYINGKIYHIGPRRMKHIETAIKFRNKIADIKKLDQSDFKIVLIEKPIEMFKRIRQQEIRPFTFEGVFK